MAHLVGRLGSIGKRGQEGPGTGHSSAALALNASQCSARASQATFHFLAHLHTPTADFRQSALPPGQSDCTRSPSAPRFWRCWGGSGSCLPILFCVIVRGGERAHACTPGQLCRSWLRQGLYVVAVVRTLSVRRRASSLDRTLQATSSRNEKRSDKCLVKYIHSSVLENKLKVPPRNCLKNARLFQIRLARDAGCRRTPLRPDKDRTTTPRMTHCQFSATQWACRRDPLPPAGGQTSNADGLEGGAAPASSHLNGGAVRVRVSVAAKWMARPLKCRQACTSHAVGRQVPLRRWPARLASASPSRRSIHGGGAGRPADKALSPQSPFRRRAVYATRTTTEWLDRRVVAVTCPGFPAGHSCTGLRCPSRRYEARVKSRRGRADLSLVTTALPSNR